MGDAFKESRDRDTAFRNALANVFDKREGRDPHRQFRGYRSGPQYPNGDGPLGFDDGPIEWANRRR
jgi:hypothetical protein